MLSFIKGSIIYYAEGEGLTVTLKQAKTPFLRGVRHRNIINKFVHFTCWSLRDHRTLKTRFQAFVMFYLLDMQPMQKPVKFGFGHAVGISPYVLRKTELPFFHSLVEQTEAVFVPVQYLDLVAVAVVKNEHRIREGIKPELLLHNRR